MSIGKYLAVLGLVAGAAASGGAWAGLNDGLVSHLTFDNCDGTDSSGNGNNATLTKATCVDGVIGKAIKFDGITNPGFGRIANASSLKFSTFTYATWVRFDGPGGMDGSSRHTSVQTIFARDIDIGGGYVSVLFKDATDNNREWVNAGGNDGFAGAEGRISNFQIGQWAHYTVALDQGVFKIYVNGTLVGSSTVNAASMFNVANGRDVYIGKYSEGHYPTNGAFDDFRIYNRALSAAEIQQLYSGASTCDTTTPYNQGYSAAQAACKANPSSCGITVSTSGSSVTTTGHATYTPSSNLVHIPYLDVPTLFGGTPTVYAVDLTVMPNTDPLQLKLQNAKQVQ